jgi:hypothetical protein
MRRRTPLKAGIGDGALLALGGVAIVAGRDPVADRERVMAAVLDGSLFQTSIGANPQPSIHGIVARLAAGLAERLTGRPVAPFA